MTKLFKLSLILIVFFSFTGCASFYRKISPQAISYPPPTTSLEKVDLAYRYDVLREAGNKKFVKNELKRNIKVVAVKLTNNSDSTINISKDIAFYCGGSAVSLLSPIDIKTRIQQSWPAYGLYLIGCVTLAPLDLLVFGGIGAGNMIVAGSANKNLLTELIQYDITNKELKSGESITGIIGFEALHSDPITVKVNN